MCYMLVLQNNVRRKNVFIVDPKNEIQGVRARKGKGRKADRVFVDYWHAVRCST